MRAALGPEDLLAAHDGGDGLRLEDPLQVVVEEVAVEHGHVGELAVLDRAQPALLPPLAGDEMVIASNARSRPTASPALRWQASVPGSSPGTARVSAV